MFGFHTDLPFRMHVALYRQVGGTCQQAVGNEGVVHRYDQQGDYIENEKRCHRVDLGMPLPSMRIRGAGDEALVGIGNVEGV